ESRQPLKPARERRSLSPERFGQSREPPSQIVKCPLGFASVLRGVQCKVERARHLAEHCYSRSVERDLLGLARECFPGALVRDAQSLERLVELEEDHRL